MRKTYIVLLFLLLVNSSIAGKRKKTKNLPDTDILEKSEVTFKFPVYKLMMPPMITSRKKSTSKVDPIQVACNSSNVTRALNELRKRIKCVPRDTVVEIVAPQNSKVTPNTVVVKRCGGMCSGNKRCIYKSRENVEFYVRTIDRKTSMVFCSRVKVPEDTDCECACPERKKCSIDQKYDPTTCKCFCTNKDEEEECRSKPDENFKWSAKSCSCVCKTTKSCTTGTIWSRDSCKCEKI